jgi:hypothetical protein
MEDAFDGGEGAAHLDRCWGLVGVEERESIRG